ncbi:MAG TPA: c-type cytochrome biogenesis protein CcmI [Paracoccaceae bacterium]
MTNDWLFWIVAGAMGLAVALILLAALRRGRAAEAPAAAYDLRVYRDQLSEIDRDLARGVIGRADADRLRTEISRRVLEADRALAQASAPGAATKRGGVVVGAVVLLVLAAAFWGYWRLGAPGYPDMPLKSRLAMAEDLRATRPGQALAEAEVPPALPPAGADAQYLDLMDKLRRAVAERPLDLQGQELLARNEARIGDFIAAYKAQAQVIALKDPAGTAEDHATLAELMILAAGGYISPEAEAALTEALRRDPANGTARYYSGLMFAQTGRPDLAFRLWQPLLAGSAPTDPWVPPLRAQIEEMARLAGVNYTLPPETEAAPGPSAADIEAAAEMTDEQRSEMIGGMVSQLNDRLAATGGTAEEWARLIGALGVLGETDRARAVWAEAQTRFAERPDDLALLQAAAERAGVTN